MRAFTKQPVYLFGLIALFIVACADKAPQKTISLDTIRPKAQSKQHQNDQPNQADTLRQYLNYYANDSASLHIAQLSIDSIGQHQFLNRFSSHTQRFILRDSSATQYQFCSWNFKDSSACLEAFYNWLDQAGKNNTSIPLLVGNVPSAHYNLMIVGERQLLFIESQDPINYKKWLLWYSGSSKYPNCKYILYMRPQKRTKWFKYENAQIVAL